MLYPLAFKKVFTVKVNAINFGLILILEISANLLFNSGVTV